MHKRDIVNDTLIAQKLIPAVRSADVSSTGLDRQGYASAALVVSLGNSADTLSGSVYLTVKIEDSENNSDWAFCEAADVVIPENAPAGLAAPVDANTNGLVYTCDAPTEDSVDLLVGYVGSKRYVRATLDFTGTHTTGIPVAVHGILADPQFAPAGS